MLTGADGTQQGFCDSAWCEDVVAEDSFCGLLSRHGHRIVNDRDVAPCYGERRGRPSVPPSHLAKILVLAYREGVSDEQAMKRLRYDLRWKVAVGVPFDHRGYTPPPWSSSGPACSCTAWGAWPSPARSSWPASWG